MNAILRFRYYSAPTYYTTAAPYTTTTYASPSYYAEQSYYTTVRNIVLPPDLGLS